MYENNTKLSCSKPYNSISLKFISYKSYKHYNATHDFIDLYHLHKYVLQYLFIDVSVKWRKPLIMHLKKICAC